jgi:2'-5' RNA ligase
VLKKSHGNVSDGLLVAPTAQLARVHPIATVSNSRVTDLSFPIDTRAEFFNTIGQKRQYLSSMVENTKNNTSGTAANTHLQIHYDTMWDRASSAVACGDLDYDIQLTAGPDLRRGLTLIARPSQALRARFDAVLDRLVGSEPQQYRHPASDMHMTILSLFTVTENPAPQLIRLADYRAAVISALEGIEAFDIDFAGVTLSRSAVLAQGFPRGPTLETLRERLRAQLRDRGLHASLDQRYRLITAHSTLFRFVAPLQDAQGFAALLASMRDEPLGAMRVDEVELVTNDWYMSRNSVERVAVIPLRTSFQTL